MSALEPRVYVACLSCYNAGTLHGHWLDADDELPGNMAEAFGIDAPEGEGFAPCGGEEFLVHDYEGFGAFKLGEVSVSEAAEAGQALRDSSNAEALAAYAENVGGSLSDASSNFDDAFHGEYQDAETFAYRLYEDMGEIPTGSLSAYIDWERVGRDLLMSDFFEVDNPDGGIFVFRNI